MTEGAQTFAVEAGGYLFHSGAIPHTTRSAEGAVALTHCDGSLKEELVAEGAAVTPRADAAPTVLANPEGLAWATEDDGMRIAPIWKDPAGPAWVAIVEMPSHKDDLHVHEGARHNVLISGTLAIHEAGASHTVGAGSYAFHSGVIPHWCESVGPLSALVLCDGSVEAVAVDESGVPIPETADAATPPGERSALGGPVGAT